MERERRGIERDGENEREEWERAAENFIISLIFTYYIKVTKNCLSTFVSAKVDIPLTTPPPPPWKKTTLSETAHAYLEPRKRMYMHDHQLSSCNLIQLSVAVKF